MRRAAAVSAAMAAPAGAAAQSATPAASTPAPEPSTTEPEPLTGGRAGSDFMVDTIKSLGFEYICANPGSSFRGLHESIDQLRRQREAGVPHLHARRVGGGHGARLLQDRREAAGGDGARDGRTAARVDGDLQRVVRSRAGLPHARQHARRDDAGTGSGVGAQRAGCGRDGARLHEVGRHADVAAALRRIGGARLQDRDDAAVRSRGDRRRQRAPGAPHRRPSRRAADPEADARRAAAGRFGRRRRSGEASRRGRVSAPDRRSPRPHSRRARATRSSSPSCCRRRSSARSRTRCRRSPRGG